MSSTMKISVRPPVIFTDLPAPARRAAPISTFRIVLVVLSILAFCMLAYWIPKKIVPWYYSRRAHANEQRPRCQEHKTWVNWVRGTRVEAGPPTLHYVLDHHIEDIELGLRRIGRVDRIDSLHTNRSNLSLRNRSNPLEDALVKKADVYVPKDASKSCQTPAVIISLAVPLALEFQKQGPFRGNFDRHIPLAPVDAYQKVDGVFRKGATEPPRAPTEKTFPSTPTKAVLKDFKTKVNVPHSVAENPLCQKILGVL